MEHGAKVNSKDSKEFTPIFYASKVGSIANIMELKKHGANVNAIGYKCEEEKCNKPKGSHPQIPPCVTGKNPLMEARTYEAANLLLKYGANPTVEAKVHDEKTVITAIEYLMVINPEAAEAILDQTLKYDPKECLKLNLQPFRHQDERDKNHEMSLFIVADDQVSYSSKVAHKADDEKLPLFLHPLLQVFLEMKWDTVRLYFWFEVFLQMFFIGFLTYTGVYYVTYTSCKPIEIDAPDARECFTNKDIILEENGFDVDGRYKFRFILLT